MGDTQEILSIINGIIDQDTNQELRVLRTELEDLKTDQKNDKEEKENLTNQINTLRKESTLINAALDKVEKYFANIASDDAVKFTLDVLGNKGKKMDAEFKGAGLITAMTEIKARWINNVSSTQSRLEDVTQRITVRNYDAQIRQKETEIERLISRITELGEYYDYAKENDDAIRRVYPDTLISLLTSLGVEKSVAIKATGIMQTQSEAVASFDPNKKEESKPEKVSDYETTKTNEAKSAIDDFFTQNGFNQIEDLKPVDIKSLTEFDDEFKKDRYEDVYSDSSREPKNYFDWSKALDEPIDVNYLPDNKPAEPKVEVEESKTFDDLYPDFTNKKTAVVSETKPEKEYSLLDDDEFNKMFNLTSLDEPTKVEEPIKEEKKASPILFDENTDIMKGFDDIEEYINQAGNYTIPKLWEEYGIPMTPETEKLTNDKYNHFKTIFDTLKNNNIPLDYIDHSIKYLEKTDPMKFQSVIALLTNNGKDPESIALGLPVIIDLDPIVIDENPHASLNELYKKQIERDLKFDNTDIYGGLGL